MYDKPIINWFDGKIQVNLYGICFAVGIIVCLVVFLQFTKRKGMDPKAQNFFYFTAIGAIIIGYLFAALFQATYNYIEDPSQGFQFGSGITFLGGLIGGVGSFIAIYYLFGRKKYKESFPRLLEVAPCCILIAHAFGRVGCFFAGCCYGGTAEQFPWLSWTAIDFPYGASAGKGAVIPTNLFECIFLFLLFGVCTYLYFKDKHINMAVYLGSYGLWRFLIEFVRGDHRGSFLGAITPSQFWSIWMVIAAVALIVLRVWLKKKKNYDLWV